MVDNSPISSHNTQEKKSNSFKNMLDNVKNFMKKDKEDNKPSSFEASNTKKNQDSNIPGFEKTGKKAMRSMHERKANNKEQKLPAKFKKGW